MRSMPAFSLAGCLFRKSRMCVTRACRVSGTMTSSLPHHIAGSRAHALTRSLSPVFRPSLIISLLMPMQFLTHAHALHAYTRMHARTTSARAHTHSLSCGLRASEPPRNVSLHADMVTLPRAQRCSFRPPALPLPHACLPARWWPSLLPLTTSRTPALAPSPATPCR